ncbi:hypothetical protein FORC47_p401 (plasmid) [Bacillus cereus]|nr:hypothetical protein FORC47_p401 [Bacillus cereus]
MRWFKSEEGTLGCLFAYGFFRDNLKYYTIDCVIMCVGFLVLKITRINRGKQ